MPAQAETELKFLFSEKDYAKIKSLVSAASSESPPIRQRLRAIYFDTPNCDLWKHGFTLRVRTNGKSHIQTVKQLVSSSVDRGEWEDKTARSEPDLDLIKNTPLAHLTAKSGIWHALRPAFRVNVERTSYMLETGGGIIEASFDRGTTEAKGERLAIHELELELKSGDQRALFHLARSFASQAQLHLSLISKAEHGHLLAEGIHGRAAKGSKPRLDKDMTSEQAFREICRTCLHDFDLNTLGLKGPDNVEAVHQARVAIRRLRAALDLFKPFVFDISYRKIRGELRWLARLLGAARDWDVLRESLLAQAALDEAHRAASSIASHSEAERLDAHQAVVDSIASERGRLLLLDLARWIEDGRWRKQPSTVIAEPIQSFASHRLKKCHRKLVKEGAGLAHLALAPRHKVRIKAKELRYMAEFFVGLPGVAKDLKRLKRLIACCEELQAALGAIRDAEAMAEHMESEAWEKAEAASGGAISPTLASPTPPQVQWDKERELKRAVRAFGRLAAIDAF
jgi:triphosphatase